MQVRCRQDFRSSSQEEESLCQRSYWCQKQERVSQASSSDNVGLGKAKSKKKNTEDAVAAPSGAKQVKPKNKKNDQVSEAQKKAKK